MAGVASSLWSASLALAVVPLYLRYLGLEAFGLIALFTTTQALLQLLDMGLAPTMNREVAKATALGSMTLAATLLRSLSRIYWVMAVLIFVIAAAASSAIAHHWVRSTSLTGSSMTTAVILMGLVIACRWPIGLYQGVIMGAQRLAVSSLITAGMNTASSIGAVCIIAFVSPTIEAFFAWQACVGIAYAVTMRTVAWRILGTRPADGRFSIDALKKIWRFSAGMSAVAITGVFLVQLDKLLLSKILDLGAFGAYALAATLSSGLYILLTPTFNVIYPRLSAMAAANEHSALQDYYRTGTRLLLAGLFPLAVFISAYSNELLMAWTGNAQTASIAAPIVSIFVFGTALNGAMHFPHALQLALGNTRAPLQINLLLLLVMVPATLTLAHLLGAQGGAWSWALTNVIYLIAGTYLTHRTMLPGIAWRWLLADVGAPFVISVCIVAGLSMMHERATHGTALVLIGGAASALMASAVILLTSARVRSLIFARIQKQRLGTVA